MIPAHWEIARIGELVTLVNGYPFDSEHFIRGEGVPLVRIRDLSSTETEVNYTGPVVDEAWIETGDVVIGMDGDFNVGRWRGPRALLNQRMCCLRPRSGADAGFVAYVLPAPLKVVNELTYSTTVKHLSSSDVRKIRLGTPPEPEQRAIAAFLDRETARIDALVAKKERLIELLQEKRTALITRAVTKGLDPTVPMKDSGVEWLGEIPAHWEVTRSKNLFSLRNVRALSDESQLTASQQYGVIPQSDFMAREGRRVVQVITGAEILKHVEAKDFVISMRSFQGGIEWSPFAGAISSAYVVLAPSQHVWHPYFVHLFKSRRYIQALQSTSDLVRDGQALRFENFVQVALPVVPPHEQRAIAAFLDRETGKLDALIAKVREAIEHLKELRTALISAAVTGKIDVRGDAGVDVP